MTAIRNVTLTCDHEPRCRTSYRGDDFDAPSQVRRAAHAEGWRSRLVRSGMRIEHYWIDLCPVHRGDKL